MRYLGLSRSPNTLRTRSKLNGAVLNGCTFQHRLVHVFGNAVIRTQKWGRWVERGSAHPPARCANPARCATPRSRRQSCCCLIRQLLASPPPSSNTPALHIPPGSFQFDRQQRQQRRSHLLFVPLFTWNAEGILRQQNIVYMGRRYQNARLVFYLASY